MGPISGSYSTHASYSSVPVSSRFSLACVERAFAGRGSWRLAGATWRLTRWPDKWVLSAGPTPRMHLIHPSLSRLDFLWHVSSERSRAEGPGDWPGRLGDSPGGLTNGSYQRVLLHACILFIRPCLVSIFSGMCRASVRGQRVLAIGRGDLATHPVA